LDEQYLAKHWQLLSAASLRIAVSDETRSGVSGKVRAPAEALISIGELFDLGIANASVMACPKSHTSDRRQAQRTPAWISRR
jgi:hypothetical protein